MKVRLSEVGAWGASLPPPHALNGITTNSETTKNNLINRIILFLWHFAFEYI